MKHMNKKNSSKNILNFSEYFIIFLFYVSTYVSFLLLFLTFDVVQSPDFAKYIKYYLFYNGEISNTGVELGNLYFFYNYLGTYLLSLIFKSYSLSELINISIHITSTLLFLFGLLGYKKYLIRKGFKKTNVYLSLILLNFLPSCIEMRLTLKPEIFAFSLLGWILYYLSKYSESADKKYLHLFILFISFALTSKASISLMLGVFLFIEIWINYKFLLSKQYLKYYLLASLVCLTLIIENSNLNGKYLNQVEHSKNYDNKAEIEFFTNINSEHLVANPNRYFHRDSFISATLFDTFSDFFLLYWNSEHSELNKGRENFFKIDRSFDDSRFPNITYDKEEGFLTIIGNFDARYEDTYYTNETRMRGAYNVSIIFYILLIVFGIYKRKDINKLLSPFLGMVTISLSALGIFGNNFDPLVGDSIKTYYYSFFIAMGFLFLLNYLFELNFYKKMISFFLILFFFFVLGFPKSFDVEIKDDISYKNALLPTCEINVVIVDYMFGTNSKDRCDPENFIYEANNKIRKWAPVSLVPELSKSIKIKNIPYLNLVLVFIAIFITKKEYWIRFFKSKL